MPNYNNNKNNNLWGVWSGNQQLLGGVSPNNKIANNAPAQPYQPDPEIGDQGLDMEIYGCTDPNSDNYNPQAVYDNDDCTYGGAAYDTCPSGFIMTPTGCIQG